MNYEDIFTFTNLLNAAKKCMLGVGWKGSVQAYRNNLIPNITKMLNKLEKPTYKSMSFYEFTIHERGKERNIKSLHISERVMQKCLCENYLIPLLEPKLIYDNAACRKGKGVHFSIARFVKHLRAFNINYKNGYVLIFDFKKYFESINHDILIDMLRKIVEDKKVMTLLETLIKDFGDKGLGLGSEISQILAIFYPNKIDRLIKEQYRIKYYGRYMDDGYIIHHDKDVLKALKNDIIKVATKLDIKINDKKTLITPLSKGVVWLKTKYTLSTNGKIYKKPYKKNITRMRVKLKKLVKNDVPKTHIITSYTSWLGSIKKTNAHNAIKEMENLKWQLLKNKLTTN